MRKYARVLDKTLANITNEYMGFQSALYNPTHVYAQSDPRDGFAESIVWACR